MMQLDLLLKEKNWALDGSPSENRIANLLGGAAQSRG